jgi:hypothetical protein
MGTAPELEDPIWQEDRSLEPRPFKIYETLPHCRARTRPPPRRCPPWRRWPGPGGAAGLRVASRLWPRRRSDAGTAPGCGTSSPSSPPPTRKRPRLSAGDRLFWVAVARLWRDWRRYPVLVRLETVLRWHRQGWLLILGDRHLEQVLREYGCATSEPGRSAHTRSGRRWPLASHPVEEERSPGATASETSSTSTNGPPHDAYATRTGFLRPSARWTGPCPHTLAWGRSDDNISALWARRSRPAQPAAGSGPSGRFQRWRVGT